MKISDYKVENCIKLNLVKEKLEFFSITIPQPQN
jgi:hypothetical protein